MLVAAVSRAATVTSANDYPSSLETGASADHRLVFTIPSGASEGETIVVSFDGAFDLGAVSEDDVDVEDDGTDLTTAGDCLGLQQTSVEASTIPPEITITICPGDGGSIAAGSEVTVRIGTAATASGTGVNQIGNPADEGTYYVSIAGTFGDSGSIALPMLDAGSVSVLAEVALGGGGGGGTPPGESGCGDSTDPAISSIVVSGITESSATVSWSTDEGADSRVDYGTTSSYEVGTETDTSLSTSHSIVLSGLSEGTDYHVRVRSADLCANETSSSDQTFTTLDATAPVITGIEASLTCDTSASVSWVTNEDADSFVSYGLTSAYGATVSSSTLSTSHAIVISGLSRDTTYHYVVASSDAAGNETVSADQTFTTDEDAAPSNVSGFSVTAGDGANALSWTNPSSDFDGVRILACTDEYPVSESDSACSTVYDGTSSAFSHTGLTNGVAYYYGAFSYDGCGQFASGALATGTPSAPEEEVFPTDEEVPPVETPTDEVPAGTAGETTTETEGETPSETAGETPSEEVPAGETTAAEEETPEIPPTTVSGGDIVPEGDVSFFVANRQIQLTPTSSGVVAMLSSRPLRVALSRTNITKEVSRVQLVLGDSAYLMAEAADGSLYSADVSSPGTPGEHGVAVSIFYADGTAQSIAYTALVKDDGYVFAQADGDAQRIGGAAVTLLEDGTVSWDGSPLGQFNPFTTGNDGQFGWYVSNATYALSATASGYLPGATGTFSVTDNIVSGAIRLESTPDEAVPPTILPGEEQQATAIAAVTETVSEAVTKAIDSIADTLEIVRDVPGVEETAAASSPVLAVATTAATVVLVTSFDLLPFLQYFFTSPFLFFWRRKRRAFGVVYNSITKVPIDLATVRLFQMPDAWQGEPGVTGRLVQSRVTDKGGRYFFLPPPGRYRIVASKSAFSFPSSYLGGVKDDGEFLDIYHGEPVVVTEQNANVAANIPLDLSEAGEQHAPKTILRRARLRRAQRIVAISGMILALSAAVIRPTVFSVSMLVVQVALFLLVRRLAAPRKPKSWGIVYDTATGRPLERVIARVFEPKYNKLLETAVTDSKGRYTFLLGPNEYFTVYEKAGFETHEVRPIDYRSKTEPSEYSQDVRLSPTGPDSASLESPEAPPGPL